ncbi:hypothetical protein [Pseudoalteromonas obscura]|uniref:Uncharacterized protein n=1 Tax=Pseudoalteromonas obscura TaxID=3048491 RepID=A0ABT7EUK0_9GAMM|nr:hypothetical protein [Pseudoalteromonas sp. P94(2023)]MDK2598655.1 hypothetical protein [Pseudoalteromonas sp. P94(2023)]
MEYKEDIFAEINPQREKASHQSDNNYQEMALKEQAIYDAKRLETEKQLTSQLMELGLLGKLLGSGESAKMSIVVLVIIFFSTAIIVVLAQNDIKEPSTMQLITLLMNIIAGALGYVFGQRSKQS